MESTSLEPKAANAPAPQPSAPQPSAAPPAVSIVVPCYNGGRFLDNLIESLRQQTFRDFEIVLVDDGSDEEETRQKLAALDAGVRLIRQENRGPSAARNTGIEQARADIVAMVDCDDTVEPSFLAETVPVLQNAPPEVAMVFPHVRAVGGQTTFFRRHFNRFDLLFTNTLSVCLVMRKASWHAVGGYDESMREGYEDWDFSLRLADAGYRGIEVPKPLYTYYIWPGNTWSSRSLDVNRRRLHAKLWRQIREKHAADYRLLAMLRLWWTSRDGTGAIPLWKGLAAFALVHLMPEAWYSKLITGIRNNRTHSDRRPRAIGLS